MSNSQPSLILVLNCGSSSIKFAVFPVDADPLPRTPLWNGKVQGIGGPAPNFGESGVEPFPVELDAEHPHTAALQFIFHQRVKTTGFQPVSFSCENEEAGGVRWTTDTAVTRYFRSSITLCG